MDVTPLIKAGAQIIQSYAGGVLKISGESYDQAIIVSPDQVLPWHEKTEAADLTLDDFKHIAETMPEAQIVLLGTGKTLQMLSPELRLELKDLPFTVDMMDTGAACRTYNVLMAEGRRVVAALLPF